MKPIPTSIEEIKESPSEAILDKTMPSEAELDKVQPEATEPNKESPEITEPDKDVPIASAPMKELPPDKPMENCVVINGEIIEIKPTKLKYFRNKMASTYSLLKTVPLNELLAYGSGVIDESKDADKLLFDFLTAAFDDSSFVAKYYDEMTADDVEKVFKIFGRLNHIDEKEEALRKNREAQAAKR